VREQNPHFDDKEKALKASHAVTMEDKNGKADVDEGE
jgi:hypothetical protein